MRKSVPSGLRLRVQRYPQHLGVHARGYGQAPSADETSTGRQDGRTLRAWRKVMSALVGSVW